MPNICDDGQLPDEDQRVVIYETYCLDWPAFLALNYRFYDFQENFTPMHRILHHYTRVWKVSNKQHENCLLTLSYSRKGLHYQEFISH
jgi:hypothetical protein